MTENNFSQSYWNKINELRDIVHQAKLFTLANYKKIGDKDWYNLKVLIKDGRTGQTTFYAPKVTFKELNNNPVKTLDEVTLDYVDGDFSVQINGNHHLWIDDLSIITIAEFIENKGYELYINSKK